MLKVGIVGLPNVGKSTLFNAITRTRKAEAANYPFCTIEPNVGIVEVPDERLPILAHLVHTEKIVPAAIEFIDIAGLVKGACQGEGLGNQFLDHIRKVNAIVQVVRCFENPDILHTMGTVDPLRDIDIIHTELLLADLQSLKKQADYWAKKAKSSEKEAVAMHHLIQQLQAHLNNGQPARSFAVSEEEAARMKMLGLLTQKPILYVCNVSESDWQTGTENHPYISAVQEFLQTDPNAAFCVLSAQLEAALSELSQEEAREYLSTFPIKDSGVNMLIQTAYRQLRLASYFTAGEKEARTWTFRQGMKAPECAGIIHTDFQRGFIKAEVVSYHDFVENGGWIGAREKGKVRLEGKEYVFQEGDIALFKFNVTA